MTTTTRESRGRIAYTAYCRKVDFKSIHGEPLPTFDEQSETIREAWIQAANVVWDLAKTGRATL
jgi:hypothetical protein